MKRVPAVLRVSTAARSRARHSSDRCTRRDGSFFGTG